MIDFAFLFFLTLLALATPSDSSYKPINILLAGKFCVFIGIHYLTVHSGFTDGFYVDIYRAGLDIAFMMLFWLFGGFYLAFICFLMVGFHISNTFIAFDYTSWMICFQILQLAAAVWGALDYEMDRFSLGSLWNRSSNNSHS